MSFEKKSKFVIYFMEISCFMNKGNVKQMRLEA